MKTLPKLSEQLHRALNLAGLSKNTKRNYYEAIVLCKKYFRKSLILLSKQDLEEFFSHLIDLNKSQGLIRLRYYALKFLFSNVYKKTFPLDYIPLGKQQKRLPVVFDFSEIKTILDVTTNKKHKAILSITYSGGLRISETQNLQVADIDSKRMTVKVTQGKGKKDRYTILSRATLTDLRLYYAQYYPDQYLFPGYSKDKPLATRSMQMILEQALEKAGIQKPATFHTLRHSFATHLYENGIGLPHIQKLMGHKSLKTTMVYVHLAKTESLAISSPLDSME